MTARCRLSILNHLRLLCALATVLLLTALPAGAAGKETEPSPDHRHHAAPPPQPSADVGLDERLGSKLDLDARFRDENGTVVRLGDLISGPTIILPVYYTCTNVCNYLQGGLARVLPALKAAAGSDYRVISISFDPSETPEQATRTRKMYLTAINAPFPENGWRFLTGEPEDIRRFTTSIGYRFKQQGRDFVHPVASLIVSGDGTIVRYLYGTSFLSKDISLALLEAREGKVGTTIRKVVDFCFTFDPQGKTYVFNILKVSATVVILSAGGFLLFLLLTGTRRRSRTPEEP
ncbi:SCO family protein [Trichlorobacter ammonificans]|uniref:Cytochrome c oxidase, synthesis factor n=1 Tax=Trichlorobacter ammonificans TaxID=2916410 RepID=A0ABM9D9K3_9BACT|nr:SCO family protein [Trichlorobacter ammonificans]CAH2031042.1 cytochrome c oxidase, synthesis factor [Trichlorobacter ammonificans]